MFNDSYFIPPNHHDAVTANTINSNPSCKNILPTSSTSCSTMSMKIPSDKSTTPTLVSIIYTAGHSFSSSEYNIKSNNLAGVDDWYDNFQAGEESTAERALEEGVEETIWDMDQQN